MGAPSGEYFIKLGVRRELGKVSQLSIKRRIRARFRTIGGQLHEKVDV